RPLDSLRARRGAGRPQPRRLRPRRTAARAVSGKGGVLGPADPISVMAGLVPAIHVLHYPRMSGGYVYILASALNGVLYVGVTNDLVRRIYEHRNVLVPGFTKKYSV